MKAELTPQHKHTNEQITLLETLVHDLEDKHEIAYLAATAIKNRLNYLHMALRAERNHR